MVDGYGGSGGHWMTSRYILALAIIALSAIVAHVLAENLIARHQGTLEVVNVSGRQRMLSQRTALLVEKLSHEATPTRRVELLDELRQATATFEAAHHRLTGTGGDGEAPLGPAVRDLYFAGPVPLNDLMLAQIGALHDIVARAEAGDWPSPAIAEKVSAEAIGPLLARLEEMVARYQANGERGFRIVRDLGQLTLLITLLTLAAEALLIFRPMVRRVERQLTEIVAMTATLRGANERLEEQVRERTAELETARDAAERANGAKSRFLAHAGHDLKQPLEAIGMFTGLLERHVHEPRAHPILADMRLAQQSMRGLLNAILDLSKLESGVVEARVETVALGPLLDNLSREFGRLAEERELRFSAPATHAWVRTDPALLERIIRNFLSNAFRYTEEGGVVLGCRRRDGRLWVEVHDTGPGIPDGDRARIFEEFIQLDRPNRDRSEGIGLGLAIADRLARLVGHPLEVRARKRGGTVFSVGLEMIAEERELEVA